MTTTQDRSTSTSGEAVESVLDVLHEWAEMLDESSSTNPLQSYVDLKVGTTDLSAADSGSREQLLRGEQVRLSRLFPYDPLATTASRSMDAIARAASDIKSTHALRTTYLAIGFVSWPDSYAARRPNAPVLLRPLDVRPADAAAADYYVQASPDAVLNPLLLGLLADRLGITLSEQDLVGPTGDLYYPTVVQRLKDQAPAHVVGSLAFDHRAVLGIFTPARPLAARDLRESARIARDHPVFPALSALWRGAPLPPPPAAGGAPVGATTSAAATRREPALPLDAPQRDAWSSIAGGGTHAVVAPPGSGATQLLTAAVLDSLEHGRRVLLVAGTQQEADDILARLSSLGLRHLALALPDGGDSRASVAEQLRAAIRPAQQRVSAGPADADTSQDSDRASVTDLLADAANDLEAHIRDLHEARQPWGLSPYEAWLEVAGAESHAREPLLLGPEVAALSSDDVAQLAARLDEFARLGGLDPERVASPWDGAQPADEESARRLVADLTDLAGGGLAAYQELAIRAAAEAGQPAPTTPAAAEELGGLMTAVLAAQQRFGPDVWDDDLADLAAATGDRAYRASHERQIGPLERRRLRSRAAALSRLPGLAEDGHVLHSALVEAESTRTTWVARCHDGRLPRVGERTAEAAQVLVSVADVLAELAEVHPEADVRDLPLSEAAVRLRNLAAHGDDLQAIPRRRALQAHLESAGLARLLAELRQRWVGEPPGTRTEQAFLAVSAFELQRALAVSQAVVTGEDGLRRFDRTAHEARVSRYQSLQRRASIEAAERVRDRHASTLLSSLRGSSSDPRRSAEVTHIRDLMVRDSARIQAALPVVVCAPADVPRVLPSTTLFDDVVVADAGRLSLVEAAPAILRGQRIIAVGDGHLMPPSMPILGGLGVDAALSPTEPGTAESTPSVLDAVAAIAPIHRLTNQHRCLDHRLMPLADAIDPQHHLPSARVTSPLRLDYVQQEAGKGQEDSVDAEVARVVELAMTHAAGRPAESLAVVALTPLHADRVRAAMTARLRSDVAHSAFFDPAADEPFVVVDAGRSHGLVRDAVIITTGFGRAADGRILYRFGALGRRYGAHLVNLAASRARLRTTVVSSLQPEDLDHRRLSADGARLLRGLLVVARSGGDLPGRPRLDAIEQAISDRLESIGLPVEHGVGIGAGRIPIALRHPRRPDRFVLAVLTDGPDYREVRPTPVRDRQAEMELRRRGWLTHRVFVADWFENPAGALEHIRARFAEATRWADALDSAISGPAEPRSAAAEAAADSAEERVASDRPALPELRFSGAAVADADVKELADVATWVEADEVPRTETETMRLLRRTVVAGGDDVGDAETQSEASQRDTALLRTAVRASRTLSAGGS